MRYDNFFPAHHCWAKAHFNICLCNTIVQKVVNKKLTAGQSPLSHLASNHSASLGPESPSTLFYSSLLNRAYIFSHSYFCSSVSPTWDAFLNLVYLLGSIEPDSIFLHEHISFSSLSALSLIWRQGHFATYSPLSHSFAKKCIITSGVS